MSFIGNGNIKGKISKKDRIRDINNTLDTLSEKQLNLLQGLVLEIRELKLYNEFYSIRWNKNNKNIAEIQIVCDRKQPLPVYKLK